MGLKELLAEIEQQVDGECLSNSCSGDGCRVYLTDVPSDRVIINLECEFERRSISTKRCDYILFCGNDTQSRLTVILIELKSGTFKALPVVGQLQGAADFVTEIFAELPAPATAALQSLEIRCVPILFHGKGIDKSQRYKLERAKIRFRRQTVAIQKGKCGQARNLASVLRG